MLRGNGYGDLYIKIITEVPSNLNSKQKELLEEFRKIESEKSSPIIKKVFLIKQKNSGKILNLIWLCKKLCLLFFYWQYYF